MARLAADGELRRRIGRAGHLYWSGGHSLELMADDYRRIVQEAAARPAPRVEDLPAHFTDDCSALARRLAGDLGVVLDRLV
jgi:hypothetical protein